MAQRMQILSGIGSKHPCSKYNTVEIALLVKYCPKKK